MTFLVLFKGMGALLLRIGSRIGMCGERGYTTLPLNSL